jgi:diguanylate cyclase (GGDEF)-like protein
VRRLSFATLDAPDRKAVHRTLAAELFEVFAVDGVHVCVVAQDRTLSRGTAFALHDGEVEPVTEYVIPFDRPSGVRHVLETGLPLNVPDAAASELVARRLVERFRAASLLYVPLAYEGSVRAVVILVSRVPRRFDSDEVDLVYTLANQASAGLAVLEMRGRLHGRVDKQAALARAAGALGASLDRRAVLDTLCCEANLALGADLAGVYLGDAVSGGLAVAADGVPEDSDWWGSTIRPGEGVGGQVLLTAEPVISNAYQQEVHVPATDVLAGVETAVAVPVRRNGELRGALSVAFYTMRQLADEDIDTLQAIADLAGAACSNAEAFEQAQAAARTDSLTGLLNHGAIQLRIREEIWRARRSGKPLACLLMDLDNFKPINDRHGHLMGDEILKRVAGAIAAEFRPYDGLARYGGDEFVLVLSETDRRTAEEAAQRLADTVGRAARGLGDLGVPITASVGVAHWCEPLTAAELLDRADRALLLAKRRGKARVVVASAETKLELANLEGGSDTPEVMNGFWDMASGCEEPRDMLLRLPAFLQRELGLEEVALFEPVNGSQGCCLTRIASARTPGDPGRKAFTQRSLRVGAGVMGRVSAGAVVRDSLAELEQALELDVPAHPHRDLPGSYAAVGLVRSEGIHGSCC